MSLTKRDLLIAVALVVVVVALHLPTLGSTPLRNEDEKRDIRICREMEQHSSMMVLWFNNIPYPDKPPLYFWSVIGLGRLTGEIDAWEARFPSVVSGGLLIAVLFIAGTLSGGMLTGLLTAAVGATAITFHEAREGRMNMMMTLWVACATLSLFMADRTRKTRWGIVAGLFMGLGMLTKGPFAIVMPVVSVALFAFLRRRDWTAFLKNPIVLASAIGAAMFFAWYLPASWAGVGDHLSPSFSYHNQPVYYYALPIFRVLAPWSVLSIPAVCYLFSERRYRQNDAALLWFIWLAATIVVVSLYPPKRLCYLLFLAPPFALLMGWYLREMIGAPDGSCAARWHDRLMLFLLANLMVAAPLGLWLAGDLFGSMLPGLAGFVVGIESLLGGAAVALHRRRRGLAVALFVAVMIAGVLAVNIFFDPMFSRMDPRPAE